MAKKASMSKAGIWAFTIGAIISLIAGLIPQNMGLGGLITALLAVLGIIVGFLNVTEEETNKFLFSSVAIMIALFTAGTAIKANISTLGMVGSYMWSIMSNINIFVFPATIVVAMKSLYALAKD